MASISVYPSVDQLESCPTSCSTPKTDCQIGCPRCYNNPVMNSTQSFIAWQVQLVGMIIYFQIVHLTVWGVIQVKIYNVNSIKVRFIRNYLPHTIMKWSVDTWVARRTDDDVSHVSISHITPCIKILILKMCTSNIKFFTFTGDVIRVSRVSQFTFTIIWSISVHTHLGTAITVGHTLIDVCKDMIISCLNFKPAGRLIN